MKAASWSLLAAPVAAALALALAGCGGSGAGNATADALSFVPKDAPVVATVATDPGGAQWRQTNKLLAKFPFTGQLKSRLKLSLGSGGKLDFDRDVKPLLGNDLVLAVRTTQALRASRPPVMLALKVRDGGRATAFVKRDATKVSSFDGTDLYKEAGTTYLAVEDGVIVVADTLPDLQDSLRRHAGGDHMSVPELDARAAGVSGDALLKVGVNVQQIVSAGPSAARAQRVRWVGALRNLGMSLAARPEGFSSSFRLATAGAVSPQDLPLAGGPTSPPVVRRPSDVGLGVRDLAQTIRFSEAAAQATGASKYAKYRKDKAVLGHRLGIDIDRDLIGQLSGDTSLSIGLDGGFALRSSLHDPAAFRKTLHGIVPRFARAAKGRHVGVAVPKKPDGFYALAASGGKRYVFAVIGSRFVLATDPARAAQYVTQPNSPVPAARGALVTSIDTRSVVNQAAAKRGQGAATLFTGALGELAGSVESETSGLSGRFELRLR